MNDRWETLPNAPRVLQHAGDACPAWLWSSDGQRLIWQNDAAGLFLARIKKHGVKRAAPAVPIKGQVARIIRLGTSGRRSLARIQFLSGEKPVSATCSTTPLQWGGDETVLLIVGVDPIEAEILDASGLAAGSNEELTADVAPPVAEPEPPGDDALGEVGDDYARELENWQATDPETVYDAATPPDAGLYMPAEDADGAENWHAALGDDAPPPLDEASAQETPIDDAPISDAGPEPSGRLSGLFDRLVADDALFTPLSQDDDHAPGLVMDDALGAVDVEATSIARPEDDPEQPEADEFAEHQDTEPTTFYKVTGRGFAFLDAEAPPEETNASVSPSDREPSPAELSHPQKVEQLRAALETIELEEQGEVERVSRYNFDELSRILTDKIGDRNPAPAPVTPETTSSPANVGSGALVNLGGETLVLNRLPLGILVFRDQQVLFANRAITEMVGYDSVESLRAAGLAAVFPAAGPDGQGAGPVNHLVQRDGTLVPVTARLQSMSWQGRPALMLSASTTEVRTGHEDAVRAFTQTFADILGDGYLEANRNGVVSQANALANTLLASGRTILGKELASLAGEDDALALQAFLDRSPRFSEAVRPSLSLRARYGKADILLFAAGQSGVVSGYFGLVRYRTNTTARLSGATEIDPALLSRISRGIRRPLNTVIGFADLMRSRPASGQGGEINHGYADDISAAGHEIAALVDELDDYARLRDGRYLPQRASLDLTALLESCVVRIKDQANMARVIVRNAISESLPRITADRASLAQAVLNLLASAIDQTPVGGAVVISAQRHDDGAIAIHVRDSSAHAVDMAERFVVFRDGTDRSGQVLAPVRSSVGLALTRSLLAVNSVSLSVDPAGADGMLFTLKIPGDLVDRR